MYYLRTGECSEVDPEKDLHEIDVTSMKDVLLEFAVKTFGGEAHGLADSGFGYSQILPIVVRGLIAQVGSTIMVEQPELHLNPAIQVRLAEFLMSLVVAGKRVLIETHSEHIVNSIRVLSAEDPTNQFAGKCKVVYVNTESGKPQLRQLEIQPDGTIPEWPRQFFGEALTLSARLLKAQNRKSEKVQTK
jgi:predicted ATPase